jgi:hypothetical protein
MIAFSAGAARLHPLLLARTLAKCTGTQVRWRAQNQGQGCSTTCASRATFSRAPIGGTDIDPDTITGTILYAWSTLPSTPPVLTPDPVWAPMCGRGLFIR